MRNATNQLVTGEGNAPRVDGNHEDYAFTEGPAPTGAKYFGFDPSGHNDAKVACIAYSGTIPNPMRGIDTQGNYWCCSADRAACPTCGDIEPGEGSASRDPLHQDSLDAEQAYVEHRKQEQIRGCALDMFLQPIKKA